MAGCFSNSKLSAALSATSASDSLISSLGLALSDPRSYRGKRSHIERDEHRDPDWSGLGSEVRHLRRIEENLAVLRQFSQQRQFDQPEHETDSGEKNPGAEEDSKYRVLESLHRRFP
jgi:hypothetical protein